MSSPPRRQQSYSFSSSPSLPSPSEILAKVLKPPLRSENQATPTPDNVRTVFTSAAGIPREAPEIDIESEKFPGSPLQKTKPSRPRKKVPALEAIPMPTKSRLKFKDEEKASQRQDLGGSEGPCPPKTQVTKEAVKRKSRAKTETVSRHFAAKESVAKTAEEKPLKDKSIPKPATEPDSAPYHAEPALKRRDAWTPPPGDNPLLLDPEPDNRELRSVGKGSAIKDVFQTLHGQYGSNKESGESLSGISERKEVLKKRKLIECVSINNGAEQKSREASPSKPANAKKKARTLTELATAPYMPPMMPELDLVGPSTKESLLSYFDEDGSVKALVEHQTALMSNSKGKGKGSKAAANPKRKKKSGTAGNPILLSPSSAMKQTTNQDFVFGTSSQLVGEESPTTLKNLQLAMRMSNRTDYSDPFADSDSNQGLWRAGARDTDGDLIGVDSVDVVDLFDDSELVVRHREPVADSRQQFIDINDILKSSDMEESAPPSAQPDNTRSIQTSDEEHAGSRPGAEAEPRRDAQPDWELFSDTQLSAQVSSFGFKPIKRRQAMIALLDQCWASKNTVAATAQTRPISSTAATSRPKKKVPATAEAEAPEPKRRGRPRKDSTAETTASAVTTKKPRAKKAPAASPKKPRGRAPKKKSTTVEIADSASDSEASLGRPRWSRRRSRWSRGWSRSSWGRSRSSRSTSSPPAADLSLTAAETDERTARLFRRITRAVTSAPRSRDPAQPSWHEKMLLYDPVVLEDFADWLNSGPLAAAAAEEEGGELGSGESSSGEGSSAGGKRKAKSKGKGKGKRSGPKVEEVLPEDVKSWCEARSIVCLWRYNLRGRERKRF
ncbi:hypothetical protein GGS23DRAFT_616938 [Durotheca rogersii]|uniref:uncharacterized protein n=1 Tax=Durotheca rogersii TaxID=419775 RepID=UPI00221FE2F5|nr:uncharacterized protein GGS23DRAFT_616938 [Durotheca rogersii]KAI5865828.1 hypothetical protein GGS23DRAFT_616938 [Durotheca rogersii]